MVREHPANKMMLEEQDLETALTSKVINVKKSKLQHFVMQRVQQYYSFYAQKACTIIPKGFVLVRN